MYYGYMVLIFEIKRRLFTSYRNEKDDNIFYCLHCELYEYTRGIGYRP